MRLNKRYSVMLPSYSQVWSAANRTAFRDPAEITSIEPREDPNAASRITQTARASRRTQTSPLTTGYNDIEQCSHLNAQKTHYTAGPA